jgi:hypothetical protein
VPPLNLMADAGVVVGMNALGPQYSARDNSTPYPLPITGRIYTGTLSGKRVLVKRFFSISQYRKDSLGERIISVSVIF